MVAKAGEMMATASEMAKKSFLDADSRESSKPYRKLGPNASKLAPEFSPVFDPLAKAALISFGNVSKENLLYEGAEQPRRRRRA